MLSTSTMWAERIQADTRKTITLVICELCPQLEGYPFASAAASSEYDTDHAVGQLVDGRIREVTYDSGGHLPVGLWGKHPGWWSLNLSDGAGVLSSPETITIQYAASIKSRNFFVVAPASNFPVNFTLEISTDGVVWELISTVVDNANYLFSYRANQDRIFAWVRLSISKISGLSSPVKILQAGAVTTIVFELYDSDVMKLTEELMAPSEVSPLGLVSSNWIEFAVANEAKLTDQDNTSSFFWGLLGKNFRFRPFMGLRIMPRKEWGWAFPGLPVYYYTGGDDKYEFVPMGVFWNRVDDQSTTEIVSRFMGYDLLSRIKDLQPPILAVQYNTTIYELFEMLFVGIGLTKGQYWIDKDLSQVVREGFFAGMVGSDFSGETVGEVLQVLAEAGCAYVNCGRIGQIVVRSNFLNGTPTDTLTDVNFIKTITKRKDISDLYDAVRVRYREPMGMYDETQLYSAELTIPPGGGEDLEIEFPDPVGIITYIEMKDATTAAVSNIYPGAVRMMLSFSNSGSSNDTVTLNVYGRKLKFFNTSIERSNINPVVEETTRILKVSNWLVQSKEIAQEYGESLLQYCSEAVNRYEIIERGDPRREIGDLIEVDDDTNEIQKNLQITKQEITWDGVLSCKIETRIAIERCAWAWVMPCQPVLESVTMEKELVSSWVSPIQYAEELV